MLLAFLIVAIFIVTMLLVAYKDATSMTIPNWISLVLLAAFFLFTPFVWQGWGVFGTHLLVGFTFFAAGFIMFALGWLGGGDAKLMAATGIWWLWPDAFLYVVYTTIAGGVLALFLILGRKFLPVKLMANPLVQRLFKDEKKMPYGIALAVGALLTLPQSAIYKAALGL